MGGAVNRICAEGLEGGRNKSHTIETDRLPHSTSDTNENPAGRAEGEGEMIPFLRTALYWCCMAIALMSGIAAVTITAAIITNELPDSQAWMAAVFFAAVGGAAWIAGNAASAPRRV
jgi:hypothetical protein